MRALGIDVGVRKGLDLVVLDGRPAPIETRRRVPIKALGSIIEELAPDAVAIDAPPRWAFGHRGSRLTEREIRRFGIQVFGTPSHDRSDHPFYEWMRVGFAVFKEAERRGFPRYSPPGSPLETAMEVFPHASAVVLAGCLPPRGTDKRRWRREILVARGVKVEELASADQVDAALAALTGLYALRGACFAPGDPKEGVIVLPARTLPPPPYRRCPSRATADDEQPHLPGFTPCACGDPGCTALTKSEFAPGHDAKRKSMLWKLARSGQEALDELRRREWDPPAEMR